MSVWGGPGWFLMIWVSLGWYCLVLSGQWYWVRIGWYWLIFDRTGSVQGGTGWYLVSLTWYCLVLSGTVLV